MENAMTMPTEEQHEEILKWIDEQPEHFQRIPKNVLQEVRDMIDQKISTGKIAAKVMTRVHEELAHKLAYHENKIEEHDHIFSNMFKRFTNVFSGMVHLDEKLTDDHRKK
jgi:hypothetical protein